MTMMQTVERASIHQQARTVGTAALASLALVAPFAGLEYQSASRFGSGMPIALFGVMWLLPFAFFVTLAPLVRRSRLGPHGMASRVGLLCRMAVLVAIAWLWVGLVSDQMPCFLGVPNCD